MWYMDCTGNWLLIGKKAVWLAPLARSRVAALVNKGFSLFPIHMQHARVQTIV